MGFWGKREDDERGDDRKSLNDEQAIERYRYMLRTAPLETIQQAHEEAFARLTPDQRRMVLQELTRSIPPEESRRATDDPASLARLATRTEIRQPGMLERVFGSSRMGGGIGGMGMGLGGMFAGSLLASIAGTFMASSIAHSFFDQHPFDGDTAGGANEFASSDSDAVEDPGVDTADAGLGDFGGGFDGGAYRDLSDGHLTFTGSVASDERSASVFRQRHKQRHLAVDYKVYGSATNNRGSK